MAFLGLFGKKKEAASPSQGDIPDAFYDDPVSGDQNLGFPSQDNLGLPDSGMPQQSYDPNQGAQVHDLGGDIGQQQTFESAFPRPNQSYDDSQYQVRDVMDGSSVQEQNGNAVQEVQIVKIEKNLEIISAKIDTLRTVLDNLDQRMKHLETIASSSDGEVKNHRPRW